MGGGNFALFSTFAVEYTLFSPVRDDNEEGV